jgi:AcrR family transcriptional regulator
MPARRSARAAAPAARQLSEQDIVDTALRLIRRIGSDKLSMRKLAAELGVTPMAIYHHVANKEALLDRIVDAVLATVPMPPPNPERWQAQLKEVALTSFQRLNAYPDLSRIVTSRLGSKSGQALARYGIALLIGAGFDEREAALATATFYTYMFGVYAAVAKAHTALAKRGRKRLAASRESSASPEIAAVGRRMRELRVEESLDYGIDAVLAGIALRRTSRRSN